MGEFEHIKPLIFKIKSVRPACKIVVMFFSPSGFENIQDFKGVDLFIYSPFDWCWPVYRFYKILKPSALIIAKHDVWPNQIWLAFRLDIPVFLVNASLHKSSSRLGSFSMLFQKTVYRYISLIITGSEEDKKNFQKLVSSEKIRIAGDTKYDQVVYRMHQSHNMETIPKKILIGKKVFVAGSTWSDDEQVLIPAVQKIKEKHKELLFIICPHEPRPAHINELISFLKPFESCLLSNINRFNTEPAIIIDRIGLLANLYAVADLAYVGGSFKQNIHNVLEPAAYGIPVLFGPVNENSNEAQLLKEHNGAFEIHNEKDLVQIIHKLFGDQDFRKRVGRQALKVVMQNTGATEKTVQIIMYHLKPDS
jgi:3-deoxy-D-manno-octulosonic-acid transferase